MTKKRSGICVAGNMLVDIVYPIHGWPEEGELITITQGISRSTGGAVCNTIIDLAKLDGELPCAMKVTLNGKILMPRYCTSVISCYWMHWIKRMINSVQRWLGCCTTHSSME